MAVAGSDGNYIDDQGVRRQLKAGDTIPTGWTVDNSSPAGLPATGARVTRPRGGIASVADGGTITHGLGATPTKYQVTATVASHIVAVTAVSSTTLTIAIKTDAGVAVSTPENVAWQASR